MSNDMRRMWCQAITVQFQILIQNLLEGRGNKNYQDFKCSGQDSYCEPSEYKLNNEAWFHITALQTTPY
jgi:hypothetical protein